jgi:hypothetical protein
MPERLAWYVLCLAAALGMIVLGHSLGRAQEIQMGHGLICNTPEQVAEFAIAHNGSNAEALQKVNVTENVCGIMMVAYIRGDAIAKVETKDGQAEIVKIAVVAINLGMGWMQGEPLTQYTMFLLPQDKGA